MSSLVNLRYPPGALEGGSLEMSFMQHGVGTGTRVEVNVSFLKELGEHLSRVQEARAERRELITSCHQS